MADEEATKLLLILQPVTRHVCGGPRWKEYCKRRHSLICQNLQITFCSLLQLSWSRNISGQKETRRRCFSKLQRYLRGNTLDTFIEQWIFGFIPSNRIDDLRLGKYYRAGGKAGVSQGGYYWLLHSFHGNQKAINCTALSGANRVVALWSPPIDHVS